MTRPLAAILLLSACAGPGHDPADGGATAPGAADAPAVDSASPPSDLDRPEPFAADDRAAVSAAFKQASGSALDDDACVEWPPSFPRVVVVGAFAHDRGCAEIGLFVDRQWFADGGVVEGLATRSFASAGLTDKERIARAWIDEVAHAFGGRFVTEAAPAFALEDTPEFAAVIVRMNKIGGVVVEGWEQIPPGMRDESAFRLVRYQFAPAGEVTREEKQHFAVDGERLRDRSATP